MVGLAWRFSKHLEHGNNDATTGNNVSWHLICQIDKNASKMFGIAS